MTARQQFARLLPLVLLIVLVIAGLRGSVPAPGWNGPLKVYGVAIGIALEAILGALLLVVRHREAAARRAAERRPYTAADREADSEIEPPQALRFVLRYVLGVCMLAIGGVLVASQHLHLFSAPLKPPVIPKITVGKHGAARHTSTGTLHIPLGPILYGLLIVALVAAVVASVWWSARLRRPAAPLIIDDVNPEKLGKAVASGQAALADIDDARAAIIACYVGMERSLADQGTSRGVADTPDELLARAVASGLVRGDAASRLTALFYAARFSTHPVSEAQRALAAAALGELAGELAVRTAERVAASAAKRTAEPVTRPGGGWV